MFKKKIFYYFYVKNRFPRRKHWAGGRKEVTVPSPAFISKIKRQEKPKTGRIDTKRVKCSVSR